MPRRRTPKNKTDQNERKGSPDSVPDPQPAEADPDSGSEPEPRPGLPAPGSIVSEKEFTSPRGAKYRIIRTRETDPYDKLVSSKGRRKRGKD
jgi:hypothetical protein